MKAIPLKVSTVAGKIFMTAMVLFLSVSAVFAQAQSSSADLNGTVTDPSDAVVPAYRNGEKYRNGHHAHRNVK